MIINANNGQVINSKEVSIHDYVLKDFCFKRCDKKLRLSLSEGVNADAVLTIDFLNVIGFNMTACDFWGRSPHVLDFEYVEKADNKLIPKLFAEKENNDYTFCTLKDRESYFETVITFVSGDKLTIACESISMLWTKQPLRI